MGQRIALATSGDSSDHQRMSAAAYTTPNRLDKTTVQVRNLLEIVDHLKDFTAPHTSSDFGKTAEPHKEAVEAALKTTSLALAQLDNIIDDMSRWNLSSDPLEDLHGRLVETQIGGLEHARKPSTRYLPALVRLQNGRWGAVLAQSGELIATGVNPGDALRAFDEAFEAISRSAMGKIQRAQEAAESAPPAPPPEPPPPAPKPRRRKGSS